MNSQEAGAASAQQSPSKRGEWPPSWNTMQHGISVGRYIDPELQALEYANLWSRVWQVAARVDEVPEVNDYTVYEIRDQSVLLVRRELAQIVEIVSSI